MEAPGTRSWSLPRVPPPSLHPAKRRVCSEGSYTSAGVLFVPSGSALWARGKPGKRTYLEALRGRPRGPSASEGAPRSHSPPGWPPHGLSLPPRRRTPAEPTLQERGEPEIRPAVAGAAPIPSAREATSCSAVGVGGSPWPGVSGWSSEARERCFQARGCGSGCRSELGRGLLRPGSSVPDG